MYEKGIKFDRVTRDYEMTLDGEIVGYARHYHEAEVTLDQLVFELMAANLLPCNSENETAQTIDSEAA